MLAFRVSALIGAVAAIFYGTVAHAQARVGPSFDCNAPAIATQPLAQTICSSDELATADLSYVIAYSALRQTLSDQERKTLNTEANRHGELRAT